MAAIDELDSLINTLPGYATLTPEMKQRALDGARVPDQAGVWPGKPDYIPTYDVYYAALNLLGYLQAQPVVRQTSSEGTSLAVDAPDWSGLRSWLRWMSSICGGAGHNVLKVVDIPDTPHVVPTDMSGRDQYYGDVDTDLS